MKKSTIKKIEEINQVLRQFGAMTIRQIYYRLLGTSGYNYRQIIYACKIGRKQGMISYNSIVDRARPVYGKRLWATVGDFLLVMPDFFNLDFWEDSQVRPAIWTEKDALSQILLREARAYNVDVYVTRGFLSISNKVRWGSRDKAILYFGDFDPSGLYIDKDLEYSVAFKNFERVALTEEQIDENDLPSVPVNRQDPRARNYTFDYGDEGWELDALDPELLKKLVRDSIEKHIDFDLEQKREEEEEIRHDLERVGEYMRDEE